MVKIYQVRPKYLKDKIEVGLIREYLVKKSDYNKLEQQSKETEKKIKEIYNKFLGLLIEKKENKKYAGFFWGEYLDGEIKSIMYSMYTIENTFPEYFKESDK